MNFYTIGDSHSTIPWGKINIDGLKIIINHLHGKTMSYFSNREVINILNGSSDGDIACFCLGEIDCRNHVNNFEPNVIAYINDIVNRYFQNIGELRLLYPYLKICIYNIVPPLERDIEKIRVLGSDWKGLGTDQDRKRYTLYMNEKLKEYCNNSGFIFFDIYDKYVDDGGFLNPDLSDSNCHIGDQKYIEEFIKNNLM